MKKLVIFDLDGTLLDTLDDLAASANHAVGTVGVAPYTREEIRSFVGNGANNLIRLCLGERVEALPACVAAFRSYYDAHLCDATKPYEGIVELLRQLDGAGVKCAVLSNKPDFAVEKLCRRYFGNLLGICRGQQEGVPLKPDPAALFGIVSDYGFQKEDCLYVGDSDVDVETARRAGMDGVAVSWGFRPKEELIKKGATVVIDRPQELLQLIQRFSNNLA